jgi:hypothetical protein
MVFLMLYIYIDIDIYAFSLSLDPESIKSISISIAVCIFEFVRVIWNFGVKFFWRSEFAMFLVHGIFDEIYVCVCRFHISRSQLFRNLVDSYLSPCNLVGDEKTRWL